MSATLRVQILVFDQVEALDFAGPYEVFTTASRVWRRQHPDGPLPFEVSCVSPDGQPVTARAGLRVFADHGLHDAGPCDLLIVPGGVVEALLGNKALLAWVKQQAAEADTVASVCTGAFVLAAAGLLDGLPVTTHWEDLADLRQRHPGLNVVDGPRWIDNGHVLTSAGIAAGLDMSLHLVGRLAGADLARRTARQMDYPWTEKDHAATPSATA
jgi:transcriptional regulator GlxA family with amidase domain